MNATPEFCLAGINWWPLCMAKGEWASWIQAVFSVVAIAAAIWIGHRTDLKARRGARNHFFMFVSSARRSVASALRASEAKDFQGFTLSRAMIHDAIQLGQSLPLLLLSHRAALNAVRYRALLAAAGAAVAPDTNGTPWESVQFGYVARTLGPINEELKKVIDPDAKPEPVPN